MELVYEGKRSRGDILRLDDVGHLKLVEGRSDSKNMLIEGDNLSAMKALLRHHGRRSGVDLVYIDPPYATNAVYRHDPKRTATVSAAKASEVAYADTRSGAEYIEFIRERIILLYELLAPHGTIFVHIDCKVGHYVKVILDEVFGARNFRNDISRIKCNPKNFARKGFGNVKDMILFYSKGSNFIWREPRVPLAEEEVSRLFRKADATGRRYTTTPLHAPGETENGNTGKPWRGIKPPPGRHWRYDPKVLDELDAQGLIEWSPSGNPRKIIYADDAALRGKKLQDVWDFKDPQYPSYPTEKNIALLRTIVEACSEPGHTILDCFCGAGTTLVAAEALGRNWIGIDESPVAIRTTKQRLNSSGSLFWEGYAVFSVKRRRGMKASSTDQELLAGP